MVATKLMTAEELTELPDDGWRYELVRGEMRRMAPAGGEHSVIGSEAGRRLGNHVMDNDLGFVFTVELGYLLAEDEDTVRAPDVSFVRKDRMPPRTEWTGYLRVAPDLAIEVVSPSDRLSEVSEKVAEYLAAGDKAFWVIEPRLQTVIIYEAGQHPRLLAVGDVLEGGDIVPGFQMPVADLFC